MHKKSKLFIFLIVASVFHLEALASSILVTPPDGVTLPNGAPFNNWSAFEERYQQVYDNSLFTSSVLIESISFFNSYDFPNVTKVEGNFEFRLSTTNASVDNLNTINLDSNIGTDNSLFFSDNFNLVVGDVFTISGNPFLYNPTQGNLLLEVIIGPEPSNLGAFDGAIGNFDGLSSRAYTTGIGYEGYGLVTEFEVTAVPIPASLFLFCSGLISLIFVRKIV